MVDLHCHILNGMDDGAKSVEESLAMAEMAIADGITHIVATPHSSNEYRFDFAAVAAGRRPICNGAIGDRVKSWPRDAISIGVRKPGGTQKKSAAFAYTKRIIYW